MVGAVLQPPLAAQVRDPTKEVRVPVPAREDSLLRDTTRRRDSLNALARRRDTLKAPIAFAEAPVATDPSGSYVWTRRDVFSTGALTVQDLLDRIPGVTGLRAGWFSQPMVSAYMGDARRVRVFLDGLELEELDPRTGRVWDLTQIPLWALDDIRIERGASEIRIHLRSWRVDRTTPFTRTDVYTGDQGTNLYRGLFGRRYAHGEVIQFAGQQAATSPGRNLESSDQLGILARLGIARRGWSADAVLLRGDRNRGRAITDLTYRDTIPATEATRTDAYVRGSYGNPDHGLWVQGIASASKYAFGGSSSGSSSSAKVDTTRSRSQYALTAGYARSGLHASITQRYRVGIQHRIGTPSARVGYDNRYFALSGLAEGRGLDSTRLYELSAVGRPTSFLFVSGAFAVEQPRALPLTQVTATSPVSANFTRAEAGVRLLDVWLSAGMMRRDGTILDAPVLFNKHAPLIADTGRTGVFAAIRGRVWKAVFADAQAVKWNDSTGLYRPQYQTRSELYISTSLPNRFPSGNFHLLASAVHEYRSATFFPDSGGVLRRAQGFRTISTLLQVRILSAEVFWNFRNILRERYALVPGYPQPRGSNMYGVRWEFWN